MTRHVLAVVFLATLAAPPSFAAEPSPIDALLGKFPHGIPWRVEVLDMAGKSLGALEMRITSEHAKSCLGGFSESAVRVEFTRKDQLSSSLSVTSYGVADLIDGRIKIDLSGGTCDAYLLMNGPLAADGSSTGEVYTFGMRGGHDVGTYRAVIK